MDKLLGLDCIQRGQAEAARRRQDHHIRQMAVLDQATGVQLPVSTGEDDDVGISVAGDTIVHNHFGDDKPTPPPVDIASKPVVKVVAGGLSRLAKCAIAAGVLSGPLGALGAWWLTKPAAVAPVLGSAPKYGSAFTVRFPDK